MHCAYHCAVILFLPANDLNVSHQCLSVCLHRSWMGKQAGIPQQVSTSIILPLYTSLMSLAVLQWQSFWIQKVLIKTVNLNSPLSRKWLEVVQVLEWNILPWMLMAKKNKTYIRFHPFRKSRARKKSLGFCAQVQNPLEFNRHQISLLWTRSRISHRHVSAALFLKSCSVVLWHKTLICLQFPSLVSKG